MSKFERQRLWRERNPEKVKDRQDRYNARPDVKARKAKQYRSGRPVPFGPPKPKALIKRDWRANNFARVLFHRCKTAAKGKGTPFDLTVEILESMIEPMVCSVTGAKLAIAESGTRHALQPSIDQIDAGDGYTVGNVRVVSWIYNRARGAGTDQEVLEMALALISKCAIEKTK